MDENIITVYDYHRNKYKANKYSLEFDAHVYGIAVKDGKILVSP